MPCLTREQFLQGSKQPRTRKVPLPELGEDMYIVVRALSAGERAKFEASIIDREGSVIPAKARTFRERLVIAAAVDDDLKPIFVEGSDIQEMFGSDSGLLGRVADTVQDLAGMDKEKNRKMVEDLAGN
jgi:hypothetical protein